jgi:hypothetical protein
MGLLIAPRVQTHTERARASSAGQAEQYAGNCETPSSNDPSAGYSVIGSSFCFYDVSG